MGEGILESLTSEEKSLGGGSRQRALLDLERATRAVQGRGLPGSSSHRNGTEAVVWSGGVWVPEGSGSCMAMEKSGNLGA